MEFFLVLDVIRNVLLAPPYEDPEVAMRDGRESFSGSPGPQRMNDKSNGSGENSDCFVVTEDMLEHILSQGLEGGEGDEEDEGEGADDAGGGGGGGPRGARSGSTPSNKSMRGKRGKSMSTPKHGDVGDHGHAYNTTVKNDRYTLKRIIESQLPLLFAPNARIVREVDYTFGRGTWLIKPPMTAMKSAGGMGHVDEIKVGFNGISGHHKFATNKGVETEVTVESIWLINNKPGPQSTPSWQLDNTDHDSTLVVKPHSSATGRQKCKHCLEPFSPEKVR